MIAVVNLIALIKPNGSAILPIFLPNHFAPKYCFDK